MTAEELQHLLDIMDDGILRKGAHTAGEAEFCALEFESQVRGRDWSDKPLTLPDLRPLNDANWSSDKTRTAGLLPVMSALWDYSTWSFVRRRQWLDYVVIQTTCRIVAEIPFFVRAGKEKPIITTLKEAKRWATDAARAAAGAAAGAAEVDSILLLACKIWIDGVKATEDVV